MSSSKSVALPVSANGVRIGIVKPAAVSTTGAWLPVASTMWPLLSTGPPRAVSPTKPLAPSKATSSSEPASVFARPDAERDLEARVVQARRRRPRRRPWP